MKRQEIVEEARKYVARKTRWRRMGRTETGLDCYGLIILVRKAFGLPSEDWFRYRLYPNKDLFLGPAKRMFNQVHELKDGQFIVFAQGGEPCHVGISATDQYGRRSIIHCAANHRVCVEESFEPQLCLNFRAAFDFPGVED